MMFFQKKNLVIKFKIFIILRSKDIFQDKWNELKANIKSIFEGKLI